MLNLSIGNCPDIRVDLCDIIVEYLPLLQSFEVDQTIHGVGVVVFG